MKDFDLNDPGVGPGYSVAPTADPVPSGGTSLCIPPPGLAAGGGIGSGRDGLGDAAMKAAAIALLGSVASRTTGDFDLATGASAPSFYLWWGGFCGEDGPVPGKFWIPALFRCSSLPEVVRDVQARKTAEAIAKGKPSWTYGRAALSVRNWHSGLGRDRVVGILAAKVEIDHLSRAEQERRYAALAAATGLGWGLIVFTGGKSLHAYLFFDHVVAPTNPIVEQTQRLLIVILEGDTKITDPGRLMRLPGWDGDQRHQPVVHLDASARYTPADVRDRLIMYAESQGITNVDAAFHALQMAERLETAAKHAGGDAGEELRLHARRLRQTRANPMQADIDTAMAMLGRHATLAGVAADGVKVNDVLEVPEAAMEPYRTMAYGSRTEAPCCAGQAHRATAAVVRHRPGQAPRVFCYRCDQIVVGVSPRMSQLDIDAQVDAMLADDDCDRDPWDFVMSDAQERRHDAILNDLRNELRTDPEHYAEFAQRVEARRTQIEAMDHDVVQAARNAVKRGKDLIPRYRKKYKDAGATWRPCGVPQGMVDVNTFSLSAYKTMCKSRTCPKCGPWVMATQVAGICFMPPLGEHGDVVGRPLVDCPDLFVYEVDAKAFPNWKRHFQRERDLLVAVRLNREYLDELRQHMFVVFKTGTKYKVLSNLDVTLKWRGEAIGDRPDDLSPASWDRYRAQVVQWVADTLDATIDLEVDLDEVIVSGRVSSSRGMTLRPGTLVQRATFTSKAVMEHRLRSVEAARDAFAKTPFAITSETFDGERPNNRHLIEVTTEPVLDGRLARAIWEQVAVRRPKVTVSSTMTVADTEALDALVDEAFG